MASPYPPPGGFRGNPEDRVEVETPTRVWEMILPFLTARVDASTGVVSGQAPPGSRLLVQLYAGDAFDYSTIITATAGGTYSVAFPVPGEPMPMGGSVTHFSAFDMRTSLHFSTPSWRVTLGAREVTGFAGVYGGPITVTLQSTNGRFTQAITQTVSQDQFWVVFQRPVYPGDRLTVETPGGLASDFTVPYVSAVYDFVRHVLEGRAPAGIELYASIPNGNSYAFRHVRLLPDGSYGVDASDLNPLVGQQGYVDFTDELGNMVICPFTVRGYPWYLPLISLLASFP